MVSRNGHHEFLDMKINEKYAPGDVIVIKNEGIVTIEVKWTALKELTGRIELVINGKVVASQEGTVKPGEPLVELVTRGFTESSWICARRMDGKGHQTHTAPIYVTVDKKPVRARAEDAQYFVTWIDNLLEKTSLGGAWSRYFTHDLDVVQNRYRRARDVYMKIIVESQMMNK